MAALSELLVSLKTLTILIIKLFLIKLIALFQSVNDTITNYGQLVFTAAQFLCYIEEKIPAIRYTNALIELQEALPECSICLSEFAEHEKVRYLKCSHLFHKDCLDQWFQQCRSSCPLCRTMVLPDEVAASYRRLKDDDEREFDRNNEEIVFLVSPSYGNGFLSYFW